MIVITSTDQDGKIRTFRFISFTSPSSSRSAEQSAKKKTENFAFCLITVLIFEPIVDSSVWYLGIMRCNYNDKDYHLVI